MKVALDFEGVLTEPWSEEDVRGLDRDLLFSSALSIAGSRRRFGARSLVSLVRAFASIEILTARTERECPVIGAWLGQNFPELSGVAVHAWPPAQRGGFRRSGDIALHIRHAPPASNERDERCVVWAGQPIEVVAREIAQALGRCPDLRFAGRRVTGITPLPSFSATPVYRIDTADGVFKLRLVEDARRSALLDSLHQLARCDAAVAELLPPQVSGLPAGVHAVPFFAGQMIEHGAREERPLLVERVARWLAALHEATLRADGDALVSCACDAFNLCVDDAGVARIVDAADCLYAPRWLDLIWSERLLCPWVGGADRLFERYFSLIPGRPSRAVVAEAVGAYYYWHHSIIRDSLRRRAADVEAMAMLRRVKSWRAPAPGETLLHRFAG